MLGLAETAALGAFLAQDLLLFVLFFDLMLVPFFFLIGAFGGENRIAATTKMIVYTLVGSLLMLVAAIATAILASGDVGQLSFSLAVLQANTLSTGSQYWIFCFFAAAFLIKMPAFLVHGWMPDAYRAAPLPVLALLSGVLSKVGAYGFLRVVLPLYPNATIHFQEVILVIGVAWILYGSVMAFTQTNVRLIAGYSSIAQLGFITIGIFSLRPDGADGSVLQMVNHGLVVGAIFLIIALLWERSGSEDLTRIGGLAMRAPVLAALFLVITLANLAMPGTANFIGEFYILIGVFQSKIVFAFVASIGVVLAAYYAIRLFQRTMHNRLPEDSESREIGLRDALVLGAARGLHRRARAVPGTDPRAKRHVGEGHHRRHLPARPRSRRDADCGRTGGPRGQVPGRSVRQERRAEYRAHGWISARLDGLRPNRSGARSDLHRPPHRLRRALARHRAERRDRRGAPGRRPERPPPESSWSRRCP